MRNLYTFAEHEQSQCNDSQLCLIYLSDSLGHHLARL
jgi:hypothetical protein